MESWPEKQVVDVIRVRQVRIDVFKDSKEDLLKKCARILNIRKDEIKEYKIHKLSLDCRRKPKLFYVYEVDLCLLSEESVLRNNHNVDVFKVDDSEYHFKISGDRKMKNRPVIVGSGPAGLFCAYLLAENGYNPIIIERGERVEDRVLTVEKFWETGEVLQNSNVQFGEGGAGTFSDGKLNTLIKDVGFRQKKVFETFVECGAPEEILYLNKPHIGTDLLRGVIIRLREKILALGGEFRYQTTLTDIVIENQQVSKIILNNQEVLECDVLVLAIGHSARDTFEMLYKRGLNIASKSFAVGVRIQHSQRIIDERQYGCSDLRLPAASYKLTYTTKERRGVYTFCMCPGGFVVNSSSEVGLLAINGMSNHKRDSGVANSAIIVTVGSKDFGEEPLDGIRFQRGLEEKAYQIGQGKIPIQTYGDFKRRVLTCQGKKLVSCFKGKYTYADLNSIFPKYICSSLVDAIEEFGKKIKGFADDDVVLAAVESRTSSPIRILRDELGISSISGIYPAGEGCGYAGGIVSASIDGIKTAENIAKVFQCKK